MIDRDAIAELVDRVEVRGLGYMLLLYLLNGATVGELHLMAREDRHVISDCLRGLEIRQYVQRVQYRTGYKWFLSQNGLSFMRLEVGGNTTNFPPTAAALLSSPDSAKAVVAETAEVGGNITNFTPTEKSEGEKTPLSPKVVAALKAAGIGSNLHAELCALEHVTPAYVKAHDQYRRGRGESVGLLITRLRASDPAPKKAQKRDVGADWQKVIDARGGGKRMK